MWADFGHAWVEQSLCNLRKTSGCRTWQEADLQGTTQLAAVPIYKYMLNSDRPTCIPAPRPGVPSQRKKDSRRPSGPGHGGHSR